MLGVAAIQVLLTGESAIPEYDSPLHKILCGIELDAPIPKHIVVNETVYQESETLLEDVVKKWNALGTISIEGFRNAFLLRKGMIKKSGGAWIVRVEKNTLDILMRKRPWGISVNRLPWLRELVYVEWE